MSALPPRDRPGRGGLGLGMLGLAMLGLGMLGLGALLSALAGLPLLPGYVLMWLFVAAIPLGALPLLMVLELTGGRWAEGAAEPLRAGLRTLPFAVLLALPVLALTGRIYPWAGSGFPPGHAAGTGYLSPAFFALRTAVYFAVFLLLARVFARPARDDRERARRRLWAGGGLVAVALLGSLAAVDWAMSLEPDWRSSTYGILVVEKQVATALALACLLGAGPAAPAPVRRDLGSMLLAAIVLWIYFHLMQYLTIWSGNLPEEVVWYLRRGGGWLLLGGGGLVLHFLVPFFVLLSGRLKERAGVTRAMGAMVLAGSLLDFAWMILPAFRRDGFSLSLGDFLALGGGLLLWLWFFRRMRGGAIEERGELRHA